MNNLKGKFYFTYGNAKRGEDVIKTLVDHGAINDLHLHGEMNDAYYYFSTYDPRINVINDKNTAIWHILEECGIFVQLPPLNEEENNVTEYCEVKPMTFQERYNAYMKLDKEELANMLATRDNLDALREEIAHGNQNKTCTNPYAVPKGVYDVWCSSEKRKLGPNSNIWSNSNNKPHWAWPKYPEQEGETTSTSPISFDDINNYIWKG